MNYLQNAEKKKYKAIETRCIAHLAEVYQWNYTTPESDTEKYDFECTGLTAALGQTYVATGELKAREYSFKPGQCMYVAAKKIDYLANVERTQRRNGIVAVYSIPQQLIYLASLKRLNEFSPGGLQTNRIYTWIEQTDKSRGKDWITNYLVPVDACTVIPWKHTP